MEVRGKKGPEQFAMDEHPRETTLEKMASLKPVFKENGTVSASNASVSVRACICMYVCVWEWRFHLGESVLIAKIKCLLLCSIYILVKFLAHLSLAVTGWWKINKNCGLHNAPRQI